MNKNNQNFPLSPRGGGFAFMAMIVIYLFISFIGQTVCAIIFSNGGAVYVAICSLFSILALGIVIVCSCVNNKQIKPLDAVGVKKFNISYLSLSIMLSAGMFLGLGFANDALVKLLEKMNINVGGVYIPLETPAHLLTFTLTLAVLPAIFEEMFFRGILLKSLSGTKIISATITIALCFALYHCSAAQFVYQLIYGAGLTLLTIVSGSVIPAIVAHFVNNFIVILFEYFNVHIDFYNPLLVAVGLAILILFFVVVILKLKKLKNNTNEKVSAFWFPYGLLGTILCLALLCGSMFQGA